jgi:alcohol dehydrogenase
MLEVDTPDPNEGEILVKVLGCTICGSDLHSVAGRRETPCPIILGHEIVGEVVEFGKRGSYSSIDGVPLAVGDRVVWSVVASCGQCFCCLRGLPQKCTVGRKYGHSRFCSDRDLYGGFAEHILLVAGTKCQKISDRVPIELACPVGCATATAVAAVEACDINQDGSVMVIGGGLVGLMTCALLKHHGVRNICCVEPNPSRLSFATQFGATHSRLEMDRATITELTNGFGFDAVVECSGQNVAYEMASSAVRLGGAIVLVGAVFPSSPVPVVLERIVRRNLRIVGIHNYTPEHLLAAVNFTEQFARNFKPGAIVDRWFELADLADAMQYAEQVRPLRVGLYPQ